MNACKRGETIWLDSDGGNIFACALSLIWFEFQHKHRNRIRLQQNDSTERAVCRRQYFIDSGMSPHDGLNVRVCVRVCVCVCIIHSHTLRRLSVLYMGRSAASAIDAGHTPAGHSGSPVRLPVNMGKPKSLGKRDKYETSHQRTTFATGLSLSRRAKRGAL